MTAVEEALKEPIAVKEPAVHVDAHELVARFELLRLDHAVRTPLNATSPLSVDTLLVVDGAAFVQDRPVPFSVFHHQTMVPRLLGMQKVAAALVGRHVGDEVRVMAPMPDTFPVPPLRGASVNQVLWVREAYRLELPAEEDSAFLAKLGLGENLNETLKALAHAAAQEQALQAMVLMGEDIALVLAARLNISPTEDSVEAERMRLWAESDGRALAAMGFKEMISLSQLTWKSDDALRQAAHRQLQVREVIARLVDSKVLSKELLGEVVDGVTRPFVKDTAFLTGLNAELFLRAAHSAAWIEAMRQLTHLSCIQWQS